MSYDRFVLLMALCSSIFAGGCGAQTVGADLATFDSLEAALPAPWKVEAFTDQRTYDVNAEGTARLKSNTSSTYLPGCADFTYEQLENGQWVSRGPNKICVWEGFARRVGPTSTYGFHQKGAGTYRLHFTVGLRCNASVPFSVGSCQQVKEVYTPSFEVTQATDPDPICDPAAVRPCAGDLVCVASDAGTPGSCQPFAHGQSVGSGYACGGSIGVSCATGLSCQGLPTPSSHLIGGSGTCGEATPCDPGQAKACGEDQVCAGKDVNHYGICGDFAHGQAVGRGYACGGSIGVACVTGLTCRGLPSGWVGGTGHCE